ncbi:hypothetical protein IQ07DRAFT_11353 [Pyrenochaeta sp. DS3sAY3a]|nr:hypothetical protein IQ07DRAFT_11353 [Pyrenochaeta sp. DS3sAY3a]
MNVDVPGRRWNGKMAQCRIRPFLRHLTDVKGLGLLGINRYSSNDTIVDAADSPEYSGHLSRYFCIQQAQARTGAEWVPRNGDVRAHLGYSLEMYVLLHSSIFQEQKEPWIEHLHSGSKVDWYLRSSLPVTAGRRSDNWKRNRTCRSSGSVSRFESTSAALFRMALRLSVECSRICRVDYLGGLLEACT